MKGLILALQFLTRFPIPLAIDFNQDNARASLFFFPWVSFLIGLATGGLLQVLRPLSPSIGSFLALILWIFLTGGLHIDGVCDTLDGFFSNRDREEVLRIMKDSTVGSFGVLGLVFLIIGKAIFLREIDLKALDLAFLVAGARLGVLLLILYFPSARPGGLGNIFQRAQPLAHVLFSSLLLLGLAFFYKKSLLLVILASLLLAFFMGQWSIKKIGGVTGDVFGFAQEYGELFALLIYWGVSLWI
ncbi:MAG: adenosylcobinamide-GDP ribazoletransferase [Tissierellia bacterium]|nr:adenosylcobinamide-GDP ribazoletransferase [Tissierellia bacterium]